MKTAIVGLSGVPYLRRACDNRIMAFAKIFTDLGYDFYVVNRHPVKKKKDICIDHDYSSKIKFIEILDRDKPNLQMLCSLFAVLSYPIEFIKIMLLNKRGRIDYLQVYSGHYFELLIYKLLSKAIDVKLIYHYVEFRSEIKRESLYHKINGYLCDNYLPRLFDGIVCISNFLEQHIKKQSPDIPLIKVPPLCDFEYFNSVQQWRTQEKYILFCGSAGHLEIIKLIIDSFNRSDCIDEGIDLVLVINGSHEGIRLVLNYIGDNKLVKIKSDIHYNSLVKLYKNSMASMIPLRKSIQDTARFPNKIGEYCASKSIMITTNVGDIPFYFTDKKNALIVEENSVGQIAEKINWAIAPENDLSEMRKSIYETGKKFFSTESYKTELDTFLKNVAGY